MSKQITSIDWLIQQFKNKGYIGLQDELQAKAMHKEEIIYAFQEGKCEGWENHELKIKGKKYKSSDPTEYYKEKFQL